MDNDFGIDTKSYQLILKTFSEFPEIERVIIFGSRAKGTARSGSDIDIAIFGKAVRLKTVVNLSSKLNEGLPIPYHIDVVAPEHSHHPDLLEHIDRVGVSIYTH